MRRKAPPASVGRQFGKSIDSLSRSSRLAPDLRRMLVSSAKHVRAGRHAEAAEILIECAAKQREHLAIANINLVQTLTVAAGCFVLSGDQKRCVRALSLARRTPSSMFSVRRPLQIKNYVDGVSSRR